MKAVFFYLLVSLGVFNSIYAQTRVDKIVKKDQSIIESKVVEVLEHSIKYRKATNLEGPIYSIEKNEVLMVVYANGDTETFYEKQGQNSSTQVTSSSSDIPTQSMRNKNEYRKFITTAAAGYSSFSDGYNSIGGIYIDAGLGYRFSRSFLMDLNVGYGTYFPDDAVDAYGITKLYSVYVMPRLTIGIPIGRGETSLRLSGGAGYAGSYGEYTTYLGKRYVYDGYSGFGYEVGSTLDFNGIGLGVRYVGFPEGAGMLKIGLEATF